MITQIRHLLILFIAVGLISSPTIPPAAAHIKPEKLNQHSISYIPGEIVVAFKPGQSSTNYLARATALAGLVGAQIVRQYQDLALLRVQGESDVPALATRLSTQPGVKAAEPNYISWLPEVNPKAAPYYFDTLERTTSAEKTISVPVQQLKTMRSIHNSGARPQFTPTYPDDMWGSWGNLYTQWWVIWPSPQPSPGVCVLDTGVDGAHPDLAGKVINGYDFVNSDALANDDNGHGTSLAGVIAAKISNGGIAGISNGKILAVKVVSAQGSGTSFDIAAGIEYCANATGIKVILLSTVSGIAVDIQYAALHSAIIDRHMLVIAAAGDNQSALPVYPAAWAQDPAIGPGLISVGAVTNHSRDIDTQHNGSPATHVQAYQCASNFSNYGAWVKMVAPGESIPSTTPVSYPFWLNYFDQVATPYEFFDGTSIAAAHVAGAAARLWSIHTNWLNGDIAAQLQSQGEPLNTTSDTGIVDKDFAWTGGFTADNAPFCWPGPDWGAANNMLGSTYLDLAKAMQRSARRIGVADATTGLPVAGTTVRAVKFPGGTIFDSSIIAENDQLYLDLINLPTGISTNFQVYKPGLTSSFQTFINGMQAPGEYQYDPFDLVPLPSNKNNYAVASWDPAYELELYVWGPGPKPDSIVSELRPGSLMVKPFMRWFGFLAEPDSIARFPVQTVRIVNLPGKNLPITPGTYHVILYDPNKTASLDAAQPIIRHWNGGKIMAMSAYPKCEAVNSWWWAYSMQSSSSKEKFSDDIGCSIYSP